MELPAVATGEAQSSRVRPSA